MKPTTSYPPNNYAQAQQYNNNQHQQHNTSIDGSHHHQNNPGNQSMHSQSGQYSSGPVPPQRSNMSSSTHSQATNASHPQHDPRLIAFFQGVDTDRSGLLNVDELHQALRNGNWQPYSLDTLHMLMQMFNKSRTGEINFAEFEKLWKYLGKSNSLLIISR